MPRKKLTPARSSPRARADDDDVVYFATLAAWRAWLARHHATKRAQWVGFHKSGTGTPSITWPESVDGALCYGWIDGKRQRIDDERYRIRFTPRKDGSIWSAVNIARMRELVDAGLAHASGVAAFDKRRDDKSAVYSYEQRKSATLSRAHEAELRANAKAWAHFSSMAPWYRRAAAHWIASAKREETRAKRFAQLVACSAEGRTVPPLTPTARKTPQRARA